MKTERSVAAGAAIWLPRPRQEIWRHPLDVADDLMRKGFYCVLRLLKVVELARTAD
ncbi:hypothetical protein [Aeromonas allosaccharophila]|uniref:hypothetical protein n=1 Tax=Aeromonas allosaccharophila TaxID=656 RepID=UPI0015D62281|nr:hypothetical protein [Aeromonas allosaccharophila]